MEGRYDPRRPPPDAGLADDHPHPELEGNPGEDLSELGIEQGPDPQDNLRSALGKRLIIDTEHLSDAEPEEAFLEALGRALEERGLWPEEAELYWGAGGEEWEDDEGAGVESAEVVVALDGEEIAAGQLDAEGAWEEDGLRVTSVQVRFDWVK